MRRRGIKASLFVGAILCSGLLYAQAPERKPLRENGIERLVLDDGQDVDAAQWGPAEATVTVDAKHAKRGETALRLHIDVDWEHGEPKYPIGWPRMYRHWPAQDWREWDYLEFSIYVEASRPTLPSNPLSLILRGEGGRSIYTRDLAELRLGQWTDFRLPLEGLPERDRVAGLGFAIHEANYKHGDRLDFWIDNISLVRAIVPTAEGSVLPERVVFGDARYLPLDLHIAGVPPGEETSLSWALQAAEKGLAQGRIAAARGVQRAYLPLPASGLKPGEYELRLQLGEESWRFSFRVIASPWQEGAK